MEKVGIYYTGRVWYMSNISRLEGYDLSPNANKPLPFKLNESLLEKGLETLFSVIDRKNFWGKYDYC